MSNLKERLQQIKDEVAKHYTSGKHTWNDGYLNNRIKLLLMDDVCKRYAEEVIKEASERVYIDGNSESRCGCEIEKQSILNIIQEL